MNVYEDKYLREKVNRIITRQKEGKGTATIVFLWKTQLSIYTALVARN